MDPEKFLPFVLHTDQSAETGVLFLEPHLKLPQDGATRISHRTWLHLGGVILGKPGAALIANVEQRVHALFPQAELTFDSLVGGLIYRDLQRRGRDGQHQFERAG